MPDSKENHPSCFGVIELVFPMGPDGLRNTPDSCFACLHKTACLKAAMGGKGGLSVREELVDKAYAAGAIGFWNRWSRKKGLYRRLKGMKK
jgi:hypothetical protein